jgi:hypothetical protein
MDRYPLRSFNAATPAEIQDAMEKAEVVFFDTCPLELPSEPDLEFLRTDCRVSFRLKISAITLNLIQFLGSRRRQT